jgi:hypothetical protein
MDQPEELPIPHGALGVSSAFEIARVWVASGGQHVTLDASVWEDPAAWGLALVDLARHIASAYEQSGGPSAEDALARIRAGFDAEWENPTDEPQGDLLES